MEPKWLMRKPCVTQEWATLVPLPCSVIGWGQLVGGVASMQQVAMASEPNSWDPLPIVPRP